MLLALVSLMHHVFVGHAIDFCIAFNCIACPNDYLLDKCSLWSFLNDCSCLIKLCFIAYISFGILIAFYLFIFVPCVLLVVSLMKVYCMCKCFRIQVYTVQVLHSFKN